jgi:hypothetical protein
MAANSALDELLRHPAIWRGGENAEEHTAPGLATGWPQLDARLPGGGWPQGALIEVLADVHGVGELGLFMPALATLTQQQRWIAWIGAPWIPFAPALAGYDIELNRVLTINPDSTADGLWAAEQLLGCARTGAVLVWAERVDERQLRRLQLAAEGGQGLAVLFRSGAHARNNSPATLRLSVSAADRGAQIDVLKCRGARPSAAFKVT